MTSEYSTINYVTYNYGSVGNYDVKISNVKELKIFNGSPLYYNIANKITRCYIPDSVNFLDAMCFYSCSSLRLIQGGNEVTTIGEGAFEYCSSLTSVSFPNVTSIGSGAFWGCSSLRIASFPKAVHIENDAFYGCNQLESLYLLGSSVPQISPVAFHVIHPDMKIFVPPSLYSNYVSSQQWSSFASRIKIKTKEYSYEHSDIEFKLANGMIVTPEPSLVGNVVQVKINTTTWNSKYSSFLPSSMASKIEEVVFNNETQTSVGVYAFYSISSLKNVRDIYASISAIRADAFRNCSSLTSVSFPNVTSIGSYAFFNCSSLTSVSFPNVTSIGSHAFYDCFYLTNASFPNVTSIGGCFGNCPNLKSIYVENDVLHSIDNGLGGHRQIVTDVSNTTIFAAVGGIDKVFNSDITSIGSHAFYDCSSLTSASFPNVTSIGSYAFYDCFYLTNASFPNVTSIGSYAFRNCNSLTSVSFPNASSIGVSAFGYCRSLTEVSFPNVTSIGSDAFYCCNRLLSIYLLGSSVPTLANSYAFYGCSSKYLIFVQPSLYDSFFTDPVWSALTPSRFMSYYLDLQYCSVTVRTQPYTGSPITPDLEVMINNRVIEKDVDYSAEFFNNIEVGTASFTLSGLGEYDGTYEGTFEIEEIKNNEFTLQTKSSSPYNKFGIYSATKSPDEPSVNIDWGDGTKETSTSNISNKTHTYNIPGTYKAIIDDTITTWTGTTTTTYYQCNYQIIDIKFGDNLTSLGNYAFYYANQLSMIDLTNCNISSVGSYAFRYCSAVKEIKIGKQIKTLGTASFDTRSVVDKITVEDGNPNFLVENGILKSTSGILYNVDSTFDGVIPSDITNIQTYALAYSDMTSIVIPPSVTTVATYACAYCSNIVCAEYNPGTTTASSYTFKNCMGLKYVKIKNNITSFGTGFVNGCRSLEVIDFSERTSTTVPTITTSTATTGPFYNVPLGVKVVVPDSLYESWTSNANWKAWIDKGQIVIVKASEFPGIPPLFDQDTFVVRQDYLNDDYSNIIMTKVNDTTYRSGYFDWNTETWKQTYEGLGDYDVFTLSKSEDGTWTLNASNFLYGERFTRDTIINEDIRDGNLHVVHDIEPYENSPCRYKIKYIV